MAKHEEPVLKVRGLTVALPLGGDRFNAAENLDFEVGAGEIVCIVGESGSGKSVTALSIMGLHREVEVTSGSIVLQGEEIAAASSARLRQLRGSRMSMIFQEPATALNPTTRVGEQIAEVFRWHGPNMSRAEVRQRVLTMMRDVKLPDPQHLRYRYPHQLSGGQRQRVMIAMAMAMRPALLIADEPTTALDVTTQAQILLLLKELQRRDNSGILFITHDLGIVADIADRVIVMRQGCIVEAGTRDQILSAPTHDYTKMLLDAVPKGVPRQIRCQGDGPPVLAVNGLTKVFGGGLPFLPANPVRAVDTVSLKLARGEILGVVGESGSGKSTMAHCIARFVDPSSGSILLDGTEIAGLSQHRIRPMRRHIQMIFQDPNRSLNPRRTIGDSIAEGAINFGLSRPKALERAQDLLGLVGLDPASIKRYPHQFSGGQRQRICIARALAVEPDVLIADEITSALDVSVQAQVLALLEEVQQRLNLAILFITHDLRVAAQICDSVAVMSSGRIVEYGPAKELFRNPQHSYTQALFASIPGAAI